MTQYQGPLPPPQLLAAYNETLENGAERVMAMIESEQKHIQSQEKTMLNGQLRIITRGQRYALWIALIALIAAAYTSQFSVALASVMVTASVGTLAVAFIRSIFGSGNTEKEEDDKKGGKK